MVASPTQKALFKVWDNFDDPINPRYLYCSDALQKAVTALYANVLVILGLALPLAEVISSHISEGRQGWTGIIMSNTIGLIKRNMSSMV